jgi:hypothetical protein
MNKAFAKSMSMLKAQAQAVKARFVLSLSPVYKS